MATPSSRPLHNLFGDLGPRCPLCSGLGRVLTFPHSASGKPTRSASPCICDGTGIDQVLRRAHEHQSLVDRIAALERQLLAADVERNRGPRWQDDRLKRIQNSRQYWAELIAWATADGTAIANTTTEAIIFPNIVVPGNYMQDGRVLKFAAAGRHSTTATPTGTWALRWGGVAGTLLATSEIITLGTVTNANWWIDGTIQTRVNGAAGSLFVMGTLHVHTSATAVVTNVFGVSGFDAPAAVTADLTSDQALSLTYDWGTASVSNTLTGHIYDVLSGN